jgi:hypothetical protein
MRWIPPPLKGGSSLRFRSFLASLVILLFVVIPPDTTSAVADSGTNTLEKGEYQIFPYEYSSFFDLDVSYFVEVTEGPRIDVFVTNEDGHQQFLSSASQEFIHYPDASTLNVYKVEKEATFSENGKYYVIIDNSFRGTDPPSEDGRVTYNYSVEYNEFPFSTDVCIVGIIIGLIIFGLLAVKWMYKPIRREEDGLPYTDGRSIGSENER